MGRIAVVVAMLFAVMLLAVSTLAGPEPFTESIGLKDKAAGAMPDLVYCDYLGYHNGSASFFWEFQNSPGVTRYAVRYTVGEGMGEFFVGSVNIAMYGSRMTGTPSLRVYVYDDDNNGLPGAVRDSVDVPYDSLPKSAAWLNVSLSQMGLTYFEGDDFHIGCSMIGGVGDSLFVISDDGSGGIPGEHSEAFRGGVWETLKGWYDINYGLLMEASRCDPRHQPQSLSVPWAYPTIQAGIDAAQALDTVLVDDGLYTSDGNRNLRWIAKPIVVKGEFGPQSTIIDVAGTPSLPRYAFYIADIPDTLALLEGFTIRNASYVMTVRAPVEIHEGAGRINDCVFMNNGGDYGGGVCVNTVAGRESWARISNCLFAGNNGMLGGAIMAVGWGTARVDNCTIYGNTANAAVYRNVANLYMDNCLIAFNSHYGYEGQNDYGNGKAYVSSTDMYGNGTDWTGSDLANRLGVDGNIGLDPYFCDTAAGDFYIDSLSPCASGSVLNPGGLLIGRYGEACRTCADGDNDLVCDDQDNCPVAANANQSDVDHDGTGDVCDPCPQDALNDIDGDGRCADVDNCAAVNNPGQEDGDEDGTGDVCDNCAAVANSDQEDTDSDGIGDACDECTDTDGDGYGNPEFPANTCAPDNCALMSNPDQADIDADGVGDVCDVCVDTDGDGFANPEYPSPYCTADNCPTVANPDQLDTDGDGWGDPCDNCWITVNADQADGDLDGVGDACDNCPAVANTAQDNADGDAFGDICDVCPQDAQNDIDADGRCADADNCPSVGNPGQEDADGNGVGDACCCVMRGDINLDTKVIVSDLTFLVNFLFKGGIGVGCPSHGDVNGDAKVIVSDLTYLVNYLFKGGVAPVACL